jgi:hypothetical protein
VGAAAATGRRRRHRRCRWLQGVRHPPVALGPLVVVEVLGGVGGEHQRLPVVGLVQQHPLRVAECPVGLAAVQEESDQMKMERPVLGRGLDRLFKSGQQLGIEHLGHLLYRLP